MKPMKRVHVTVLVGAAIAVAATVAATPLLISSFVTTYMGCTVPSVGDPGPTYASRINDCLEIIDAHDHSAGKGTKVTPAGFNVNVALELNEFDLTEARSIRFQEDAVVIDGDDVRAIYTDGVDLFYVDDSGNEIQLTESGAIAGTPGSITGMTGSASVVYSSLSDTFAFTDDGGRPAGGDFGCVRIAEEVVGGKGPIICSNAATAADFAFTFMAALPAANRLTCLDASGNFSTCTATAQAQALVVATSTSSATMSTTGDASIGDDLIVYGGSTGTASDSGGTTKSVTGTGTSSTAPIDIGGVTFSGLTASQAYFISCRFQVESDADTTGVQIGLDFSPAPSSVAADCGAWLSTAVWTYTSLTSDDGRCVMPSNLDGQSTYTLSGWFENSAATTSVVPRLRSEVGASTVTVYAGLCTVVPANP